MGIKFEDLGGFDAGVKVHADWTREHEKEDTYAGGAAFNLEAKEWNFGAQIKKADDSTDVEVQGLYELGKDKSAYFIAGGAFPQKEHHFARLGLNWKSEGWKHTMDFHAKLPFGEGEDKKAFSGAFGHPLEISRGSEFKLDKQTKFRAMQ